MLQRTTI